MAIRQSFVETSSPAPWLHWTCTLAAGRDFMAFTISLGPRASKQQTSLEKRWRNVGKGSICWVERSVPFITCRFTSENKDAASSLSHTIDGPYTYAWSSRTPSRHGDVSSSDAVRDGGPWQMLSNKRWDMPGMLQEVLDVLKSSSCEAGKILMCGWNQL